MLVHHPEHLLHLRADELVHGGALPLGPPQLVHLLPEVGVDVEGGLEAGSLQGHLYYARRGLSTPTTLHLSLGNYRSIFQQSQSP